MADRCHGVRLVHLRLDPTAVSTEQENEKSQGIGSKRKGSSRMINIVLLPCVIAWTAGPLYTYI